LERKNRRPIARSTAKKDTQRVHHKKRIAEPEEEKNDTERKWGEDILGGKRQILREGNRWHRRHWETIGDQQKTKK